MRAIIDFLKNLFAPEEVPVIIPKQTVAFAELPQWLDTHTNQNAKSIAESSKPILDKIDDAIFANQANLKKLEYAELRNKNISSRELEIMKGNRVSYIRKTEQFLQMLAAHYNKEQITYADMKKLCELYAAEIPGYHSTTLKPYAVLQHFFANETYLVAKNIKEIDELMKQLQSIVQKQSVEALSHINSQITAIKTKQQQKRELTMQGEECQKEQVAVGELRAQAEQKMKKIEDSVHYKEYLQRVADAAEHQKKIDAHIAALTHSFSVIDKAVRKYAKTMPEKEQLLMSYLEKPLDALQNDPSCEIASLIIAIRQQLDALDIKEDKREKTELELNILTGAFFQNYLEQYKKFVEEKKRKDMLCSSDVAFQQHKEAAYMHQTYKEKADALQKQFEQFQKEIEKLDISDAVLQLQRDICECTKQDVEIIKEDNKEQSQE
jgi:hypothetical protein